MSLFSFRKNSDKDILLKNQNDENEDFFHKLKW